MRAPLWTGLMSIQELFQDFFDFLFLIFWYAGGRRSEHVPCQTTIRRAVDFVLFLCLSLFFWFARGCRYARVPRHTTIRRAYEFILIFDFLFVIFWYAGGRRCKCAPCHTIRRAVASFLFYFSLLFCLVCRRAPLHMCPMSHKNTKSCWNFFSFSFFLFFIIVLSGMQEDAFTHVSHVTQEYEELLEVF